MSFRPLCPSSIRTVPLACILALTIASCSATKGSIGSDDAEWLEPSPALKQQIDDNAKRLPWTHGIERIDLIQWFAKVGEPAYTTLLPLALDKREDVAGAALAALGGTRDSRLVEPLHALQWPNTMIQSVALERARALLRLGDWSAARDLIAGLRDERLVTRALCGQALYEATHERFAFDARAESSVREESVKKWEAWFAERNADPLLAAPTREPGSDSKSAER